MEKLSALQQLAIIAVGSILFSLFVHFFVVDWIWFLIGLVRKFM
jgi:hypothetical protein